MSEDIYKVVRKGGKKPVHGKAYFSKGHATLSSKYNYDSEVKKGQVAWDGEGEVVIPLKEYEQLLHSASWLQALDNAGVDNWGGIDYAYELFNNGEEDE